jgi:hypothetical protein
MRLLQQLGINSILQRDRLDRSQLLLNGLR